MKSSLKKLLLLLLILVLTFSCSNQDVNEQKVKEEVKKILKVGFDIDDTLLFSTPAFQKAQEEYKFGTEDFWSKVNSLDSKVSVIKQSVLKIVKKHQENGDTLYAITARPGYNGDKLKKFINKSFGIPEKNIYFEPDSKVNRMKKLDLDIFYGDSDSDITDAQEAGVTPVRIQRSQNSSYKNSDGTLRKYHPGKYGEKIIENTTE